MPPRKKSVEMENRVAVVGVRNSGCDHKKAVGERSLW